MLVAVVIVFCVVFRIWYSIGQGEYYEKQRRNEQITEYRKLLKELRKLEHSEAKKTKLKRKQ